MAGTRPGENASRAYRAAGRQEIDTEIETLAKWPSSFGTRRRLTVASAVGRSAGQPAGARTGRCEARKKYERPWTASQNRFVRRDETSALRYGPRTPPTPLPAIIGEARGRAAAGVRGNG